MQENDTLSLILRAQSGDDSARDELLISNGKLVRTIARSIELVGAGLDYDDLFQVGNIGLLRAISTYSPSTTTSFKTYASHCIKNSIVDELRKKAPLTVPIGEDNPLIDKIPAPDDPEKDYIDKETATLLFDAIRSTLTDAEFEVLRFYLDGMSYAEISSKLDMKKKKVDNTIYSIKKKAKKLLPTSNNQ